MSRTLITAAPRVAARPRNNRLLAAALAAVVVAGGAMFALAGEDAVAPPQRDAWPAGPIEFNDADVIKGARGIDQPWRDGARR